MSEIQEKKIATSIDILMQPARFEHIQIVKYSEKKISYKNEQDMLKQEDQLTSELVADLIRTMRSLPDKLGKKTNAVELIEENIKKKIPEWLENNPVPNLAKKMYENSQKEQFVKAEEKDVGKESDKVAELIDNPEENDDKPIESKADKPKEENKEITQEDLFDDSELFGDNKENDDIF